MDENQGEQIWRNFATLVKYYIYWVIFQVLFSIGYKFEPTLAHFYATGQIYFATNGQIVYKLANHQVTLIENSYVAGYKNGWGDLMPEFGKIMQCLQPTKRYKRKCCSY